MYGQVGEHIGLLLHEEDLEPKSLLAEHPPLASAIRASAESADPVGRSPAAVSPVVAAFTEGAVKDAASRTNDAAARPAMGPAPAAVVDRATAEGLDTVIVPYAPVGPVQEHLETLRTALDAEGIGPVTVRRPGSTVPGRTRRGISSPSASRFRGRSASRRSAC